MSDTEFLKAIADMRQYQKAFFKAHYGSEEKRQALIKSKVSETVVDREVERRQRVEKGETLAL